MSSPPFNQFIEIINFLKSNSRNEPCWCGSGKKFKKCHLDRETLAPLNIDEKHKKFKDIDKTTKLCLFNRFDNQCSQGIISAHSISEKIFLAKISSDNMVYHLYIDFIKTEIKLKKISIGKASVFYGFCNKHDTNLFKEFEQKPFYKSSQQLLKINYRALCLEILKKQIVIEKYNFLKDTLDNGEPLAKQYGLQREVYKEIILHKNALDRLKNIQNLLLFDIQNNTSEKMQHCLISLQSIPHILCSTVISPEFNFHHEKLQNLEQSNKFKSLFLNIFIFDNIGYICISWIREDREYAINILDSIFSQSFSINQKLTKLILLYTENIFISPNWWDSLESQDKAKLQELMEYDQSRDSDASINILEFPEIVNYSHHIFL